MIKKAFFVLMLLAGGQAIHAANPEKSMMVNRKNSTINFGVKGGFNSTMLFADHFTIGGTEVSNAQNNYKVGYFASFFLRANFRHHFIQPEISYNVNKVSVFIHSDPDNQAILEGNGLVKSKMSSFDIPLLYGYKFIDRPPYGMAFFLGPKVAWIWNKHTDVTYSGFYQQNIIEKYKPLNYSAVFGLAVNVSNIFCDFRYEIGANNISESIKYDQDATTEPHNQNKLVFKRRRNVFSFSIGVIF